VDGNRVKIQELNRGNPMELAGADRRPYWVDERDIYAKCKTEGGRFTLEGEPDYTGVPVEVEDGSLRDTDVPRKRVQLLRCGG